MDHAASYTAVATPAAHKASLESSPLRPTPLAPDLDSIPTELTSRPQWVLWQYHQRSQPKGGVKWTKLPINPRSLEPASSTNPRTWGEFRLVSLRLIRTPGKHDGAGFVFSVDDPYCGVDLDACRDPVSGAIEPWAAAIIARLASYAEVSPSGTGVKIILRAKLPGGGGRRHGRIEVYDQGRYFALTGIRVPVANGSPQATGIEDRQAELDAWMAEEFPPPAAPAAGSSTGAAPSRNGHAAPGDLPTDLPASLFPTASLDDAALLAKIERSANGAAFRSLWAGDLAGHPSASEADLALCNILAFWCGPGAAGEARVDSLFRQSGLYRAKWDRQLSQASTQTYGQATIARAFSGRTEFYDPRGRGGSGRDDAGPDGRAPADTPPLAGSTHAAPPGSDAIDAHDSPHRLARLFLTSDAGRHLYRWRGEWWQWRPNGPAGTHYARITDEELSANLNSFIRETFKADWRRGEGEVKGQGDNAKLLARKVTRNITSNTEQAVMGATILDSVATQPAWIEANPGGLFRFTLDCSPARYRFAFTNGLIPVEAATASEDAEAASIEPHTPAWFSPICFPFAYDPDAPAPGPRWAAFLDRNFAGNVGIAALLQEWFGYCLLPYCMVSRFQYQKFLMLVGEGSNGKSVVCAALRAMLGNANVSAVPLEKFGDQFSLIGTLGKLVNIVAEIGELEKADEGELKKFTSGDFMDFPRKHKEAISAIPTARLLFATNNLPRFADRTGGLYRRLLLVPCNVIIPDAEKIRGMDTVQFWADAGELPGLFNWALAGLRRLGQQGGFTSPQECEDALAEYKIENNPAAAFLSERCEPSPAHAIITATVYAAYRKWCGENGYGALSAGNFGKEIRRVFAGTKPIKLRHPTGRQTGYAGISSDVIDSTVDMEARYTNEISDILP